jgi:hypothetical protein
MGKDPENRVGDQEIGRQVRSVSCGLKVTGEQEHCRARARTPLVTLSSALEFFLQKVLQLQKQK